MMSQKSKQELAAALRPRYPHAGRGEKRRIMNEFVATTGYPGSPHPSGAWLAADTPP
jgi:hypothetical protein